MTSCDRFLSPSTVKVDGTCPSCGRVVDAGHAHTPAPAPSAGARRRRGPRRRSRGTSSCSRRRWPSTSATGRCRASSGSSATEPTPTSKRSERREGLRLHCRPRLRPCTGCGAAWLARWSGGPKVPGSNPGSPTEKTQVRATRPRTEPSRPTLGSDVSLLVGETRLRPDVEHHERRDDLSEALTGTQCPDRCGRGCARRISTASWEHVWMLNAASGTVYAGTSQVRRTFPRASASVGR